MMLGNTSITRRTKDVSSTSTNGARPKSIRENDQAKSTPYIDIDPDHLTLWQHPIVTLNYFIQELLFDCLSFARKTLQYKRTVFCTVSFIILFFILGKLSGPQQQVYKK
jgi:hypothetical protein